MGLYKRNKVWWMNLTCNGKQVKRSTETKNKKQAGRIYAKVMTELAERRWFEVDEGNRRTFKELADKYESQVFHEQRGWKASQSYLNQLKEFFSSYTLSEITPALIDDFKQMRKGRGVKAATINRQLNILRRMLSLARKRWMWLKEIPVIEMEPNADIRRTRHLAFEDFHRLRECCDEWLKGIVTVAAWTGLRQGNILSLKRGQVNFLNRTLTLDSSETKNGEHLIIPLSEPAYEALKEAVRVTHIASPYVFCKEDGSPYHQRAVQRGFTRALKEGWSR